MRRGGPQVRPQFVHWECAEWRDRGGAQSWGSWRPKCGDRGQVVIFTIKNQLLAIYQTFKEHAKLASHCSNVIDRFVSDYMGLVPLPPPK